MNNGEKYDIYTLLNIDEVKNVINPNPIIFNNNSHVKNINIIV